MWEGCLILLNLCNHMGKGREAREKVEYKIQEGTDCNAML